MSKLISEQVILGWPTIVSESGSCHMAWTISLLQPLCFLEPPIWSHRHRHAGRHTQPISCPCHQYGKKLLLLWQADYCLCISHWVKLVLSCMPSVNFSTKSGRFCWHSYENSDPINSLSLSLNFRDLRRHKVSWRTGQRRARVCMASRRTHLIVYKRVL